MNASANSNSARRTWARVAQLWRSMSLEAADPDGSVALLARLARHYRLDDDILWIRPVVGGYVPTGGPGLPPYAFHPIEARPRTLSIAGPVEVGDELVFHTPGAQLVRIGPAGPETVDELERWDSFVLLALSAEDEAALDRVWAHSWWGERA